MFVLEKRDRKIQYTKLRAKIAYQNEASAQVNPQLLEWLETINTEASNKSIRNNSKKAIPQGCQILVKIPNKYCDGWCRLSSYFNIRDKISISLSSKKMHDKRASSTGFCSPWSIFIPIFITIFYIKFDSFLSFVIIEISNMRK